MQVQQVTDQLVGRTPLPWETLRSDDRDRLGVLRKSILLMLSRNPEARPALSNIVAHWCSLAFNSVAAQDPSGGATQEHPAQAH
jgi:hypothetical protein